MGQISIGRPSSKRSPAPDGNPPHYRRMSSELLFFVAIAVSATGVVLIILNEVDRRR
jgi:hypothetical protein